MLEISESEIVDSFQLDNPWWTQGHIDPEFRDMPRRAYFEWFHELVVEAGIRRAPVLMGPRRVGKTVLIYHTIQKLIDDGVHPQHILYLSLETPVYNKIPLERLIQLFVANFANQSNQEVYVFFDEIQYLKDWAVHLKSLVDRYRKFRFAVSGSAAAALKLKSTESGAGRFTDFLLPPLSFAEFLAFAGVHDELLNIHFNERGEDIPPDMEIAYEDIDAINEQFINYLNYGGFPELVYSPVGRRKSRRYIRSDIIDKVLLKDIPSLYGITDVQELNSLFTTIAFNTGEEISLEGLSKSSAVSKNTIKRYLDYLESAYLIRRVTRLDKNARRFQRAAQFKVYLTNPTMHAALFGPTSTDNEKMGHLAETAIFAQWFHDPWQDELTYSRWDNGEVDLVYVDPGTQKPEWAVEVKWSDRAFDSTQRLKSLLEFSRLHAGSLEDILVTTKTKSGYRHVQDTTIRFEPASIYCYRVGRNLMATASLFQKNQRNQMEMEI